MGVNKEIKTKAIVGDCLYDNLAKGNLSFNTNKLVLPYIILGVLNCTEAKQEELVSMYYHLIRNCSLDLAIENSDPSPILNALQLESGDFILLESGDYILLE